MKKYILTIALGSMTMSLMSCGDTADKTSQSQQNPIKKSEQESPKTPSQSKQSVDEFVPSGYTISERIEGDLNKDGAKDVVLLIKGTDKGQFEINSQGEKVDRNRRGLIILFNKNGGYELGIENLSCFSSENEEGGVYFAPELEIKAEKGNLYINYGHGRYGSWTYTFRYQNNDFELIGYDHEEARGPVVVSKTSINYSTQTKIVSENTNPDADTEADSKFKETKSKISKSRLDKLSQIKDFDEYIAD